jgi:hypothetical protein
MGRLRVGKLFLNTHRVFRRFSNEQFPLYGIKLTLIGVIYVGI